MCVQDPFVLDHNTTSNVSERLCCVISREFQLASSQCHGLIGCDDSIDAEHAGIVNLLSDSQLALSPAETTDESIANIDVAEETARIQLFLLRSQDSVNSATTVVEHRVAEPEHRVAEPELGVEDAVETISWYSNVVGIVKLMLADIFDVDCVYHDQPSEQFIFKLNQLLIGRANHDRSSSVPRWQQTSNLALVSGRDDHPPAARSTTLSDCMANDNQHRKHLLPENDCDTDEGGNNDSAAVNSGASQQYSGRSAAKRPKTNDSTSDVDVSGSSSGSRHELTVTDSEQQILLSVDCSAQSRLWVGRKKVRRQFMHFSDELKRQLEVSSVLRNEMTKSDHAILEFEMAIVRPVHWSDDELMVALLPSSKTSKEFGCFITFFISLLQKLVNNISVEGPVQLTA